MRTKLLLLITLLAFGALLSGCQRGNSGKDIPEISIDLTILPDPPKVGTATLALNLMNAGDQPISGAKIELEGNMSHAGMTPAFSEATEVEPGRYEAPLEFTMGGDWFILVKVTLPDGRTLERQIDVPGVESQ